MKRNEKELLRKQLQLLAEQSKGADEKMELKLLQDFLQSTERK